jgi:hypothetical protein
MPKTKTQAQDEPYNSNVWNILPLTNFRTIDLQGKKNFGALFSRFQGKLSVFFEAKLWYHKIKLQPVGQLFTLGMQPRLAG